MKKVAFVYHPDYLLHAPPYDHPEAPERLIAIIDRLERGGLMKSLVPVTPDDPDNGAIVRVHDPEYLRKLEIACRRGDLSLEAEDTYLNKNSYTVALLSAGGAIAGADAVMSGRADRAFCAVRPPGHHAGRRTGMGFCLLNNAAVAARHIQARHGVDRVLIVDWDVHHGNGTQEIFLEDPTVFFFSIHEHPTFLYPGTGRRWETGKGAGEGTTLNAPMSPGAGDEEYREAFVQMLAPAMDRFRPEFIIISAGFDALRGDPLADMQVTESGVRFMSRFVADLADRHARGRLVSILEGGYELPMLAECAELHIRELMAD